MIARAEHISV